MKVTLHLIAKHEEEYAQLHLHKENKRMGELKEYQIKTAFFIDRNADYLQEEVPVYKLEDAPDGMDAVLISLVRNYDEVKRSLQKKYHVAVYTMKDILEGV